MAKMISELLQAKEPLFSHSLLQLEQASGRKGVDVALTAEIVEVFAKKVTDLGLDVTDATGKEIYQALINQARVHDEHLAKQIGCDDPSDVQTLLPLLKKAAEASDAPKSCWVLKDDVAKNMLRKTPPTGIMEKLGYGDIEDMLVKENLYEIYGALRFAESGDWLNEFNTHYEHLTADDFETRNIEIVMMPSDRWLEVSKKFVVKKRHNITHLKELGVILMLPMEETSMPGLTIKDLSLLFHYMNEIRLYSAYFKLQKSKKDFGKIFVDTLIADPSSAAVMAGQHIHWRVIQRYFGKLKDEYHPEVFEPHVQPEDLHWRKAEEYLYSIAPELKWWEDLDYVAKMYDGQPLTMNFMDIGFSYGNHIDYDERYIYHFREALWNQVFMNYMGESVLEDQILKQLDNDLIEPEHLHAA